MVESSTSSRKKKKTGFEAESRMKKNVEHKEVVGIIEIKYLNMNASVYIRYIIFLLCVFV